MQLRKAAWPHAGPLLLRETWRCITRAGWQKEPEGWQSLREGLVLSQHRAALGREVHYHVICLDF